MLEATEESQKKVKREERVHFLDEESVTAKVDIDQNHNARAKILDSNLSEPESTTSKSTKKSKKGWRRYAGLVFSLAAGICFTLATLIVKLLKNYHPLNLSIWRYFGFIIPMVPVYFYLVYYKKQLIYKSIWPIGGTEGKWKMLGWVFVSAIFACTTFLLRFYALKFMTLADATVIAFSGPVCIVVLGHFCLAEKCGIVTIPIALWTILGVFIIARPPLLTGQSEFSTENLIGIALSLASVFFVACYFIIMRKLREVHVVIISLMGGFIGFAESVIIVWILNVFQPPDNLKDILLIATMALLSFLGQMTIVAALKFEQAGTVGLIRTSDVLFAFLWQLIFLQVIPDIFSLLGALIVVIGVTLTTFRSWLNTLPAENKTRKNFRFLLY